MAVEPGSKPSTESTGTGPADPHAEIMRWRDLAIKRGEQRDRYHFQADEAHALLDEIETVVFEHTMPDRLDDIARILSKRVKP